MRICGSCRAPHTPSAEELADVFPTGAPAGFQCWKGTGCSHCSGAGSYGRIAVVEYLAVNARIRRAIAKRLPLDELREAAIAAGLGRIIFPSTGTHVAFCPITPCESRDPDPSGTCREGPAGRYSPRPVTTLSQSPRSRPPGPRPRYPGQFVIDLMRDKQGLFGSMARIGDVTQIRIGPSERVVVLTHPDDVKTVLVTNQRNFTKGRALESTTHTLGQGLLTSDGEFHLRQRRLIQPAFHRDRITGFASLMTSDAEREQGRWTDGETRDVHVDMMRLTLTIAGKAFFNADVEQEAEVVAEALELALRMFNYRIVFGSLPQYVPLPWIRRMHQTRRQMDTFIYGLIEERRASAVDRGDILSTLVAARDSEEDHGGMTDKQLRDEVITLLMAGHETTAVALSWTWYLLSQHPEVEARLHAELADVLGGRVPTAEDLRRLTYTRAVFAEAMRLYPPAWILERRAVDDFEVGGYRIKAGSIVLMSQYIIHRDPRWWPEPERFMPERWLGDAEKERPKFAYFPFGAGTRICVGEHFAWMEGVLVLATIAQRWQLRHDPTHRVEREALVTLRPKYGMRMRLVRR